MRMFAIVRLNIVYSNIPLLPAVLKSVATVQSSGTDLWGGTPLNRFDSWFTDSLLIILIRYVERNARDMFQCRMWT
jgi:hypothetical protein